MPRDNEDKRMENRDNRRVRIAERTLRLGLRRSLDECGDNFPMAINRDLIRYYALIRDDPNLEIRAMKLEKEDD